MSVPYIPTTSALYAEAVSGGETDALGSFVGIRTGKGIVATDGGHLLGLAAELTTLEGDEDGVAHVTATEVVCESDAYVQPRGRLGHQRTTNAAPVEVTLRSLSDGNVEALDVVVTCRNATGSLCAVFHLPTLAWRVGSTSHLEGGTDASPLPASTNMLATVILSTHTVKLRLVGLAGEACTFGWERRTQLQLMQGA